VERNRAISTFGQFMVCPESIKYLDETSVSDGGYNDYINYKYRHLSESYLANSEVDESILLEKMVEALRLKLSGNDKEPLLLLSDGKDSMGLAVALSEMGIKCKTLSFLRRSDLQLKEYISQVTEKLGHTPFFVNVDEIQVNYSSKIFLKACGEMDYPVLDQGFFFFLFGSKIFFDTEKLNPNDYVIVDGLGNDEHFGYMASKNQLKSYSLSKLGLWKILPRSLPALRWYFRSPSESHGDLSALAAVFSFGQSYDLNKYFSKIPKSLNELEYIDFRAFSRGAFHDHQCMMGKTIATARCLSSSVIFPWAEKSLGEYCFNLPVSSKFNFKNFKNKLLLRSLLEKKIQWKQEKRGVDLYFDLDMGLFKRDVLSELVPTHIVNKIDKSFLLPSTVKKRAYLELHNFYGYCLSHGLSKLDIEKILMGNR